jgi:cell division protein FtsB
MKRQMKTNKNRKKQDTGYRIQNMGRAIFRTSLFVFIFLFFSSGCNSGKSENKLRLQVKSLTDENAKLTNQVEKLTSENEQLQKQNTVLQDLPDSVKGVNLYKLETVKISSYSGLFDENNKGKPDTLVVLIQPIDNYGDIIKAAGSVEVELWDLNKPQNQALIGKWHVSPEELKKDWVSFLATDYRLSFDIAGKIDKLTEPLTLKVTFTDYLSGKVFYAQKVIQP